MIEVRDLAVSFTGSYTIQAVADVSFELKPGQKLAIIGETGSGKSVLLLALLRLLPDSAKVSGNAIFDGTDLLKLKRREMESVWGAKIAYVPQGNGGSLNPLLRVGFQIGEPLMRHNGFTKRQAFNTSVELLKRFHIGDEIRRARQYPHHYSGGMRQRALVAMGISAGAEIIMADEPTKGLDERRISQVKDAFLSIEEQALLCVTHDLRFAGSIAEEIHVMYASRQVECASASEILSEPLHPYTRDMINAMPENGLKAGRGFAPPHSEVMNGCPYKSMCPEASSRCNAPPPMICVSPGRKVRCWKYADVC